MCKPLATVLDGGFYSRPVQEKNITVYCSLGLCIKITRLTRKSYVQIVVVVTKFHMMAQLLTDWITN